MSERCDRCCRESVYHQRYSGRYFCPSHLVQDLTSRAKKSVRKQGGIGRGGYAGILWKGSRSFSLLLFMDELCGNRRDISFFLLVPEGAEIPAITDGFRIKYTVIHIPQKLDNPCSFSLPALVREISDLQIRILFIDETLDETALHVINAFFSNTCDLLRDDRKSIPFSVITPFREIPGDEISLYSRYHEKGGDYSESGSFGDDMALLNRLRMNHPSVCYSLLSYQDKVRKLGTGNGENPME